MSRLPIPFLPITCCLLLAMLAGCTPNVFYVTPGSFYSQVNNKGSAPFRKYLLSLYNKQDSFENTRFQGNEIVQLNVTDKKQRSYNGTTFQGTSATFCTGNNNKITYYFNTVIIADSIIYGSKSDVVFIPGPLLHLRDVKKIEIRKLLTKNR